MAISADFPRLSFGASNTLDLSLNLPAVLLPPSPRSRAGSESDQYEDDRRPVEETSEDITGEEQRNWRDSKEEIKRQIQQAQHIETDRQTTRFISPRNSEDAPSEPRTPTVASFPVPLIPEKNMRRADRRPPPSADPDVPLHPIPSMRAAFAESLHEVTGGIPADKPKIRFADAKTRREELISQERGDELCNLRWRYRGDQKEHELQKLMSQISFGVYLLLNGMANSADQVVSILQGHIDEVDEFLEVAMEDFQQASVDLKERIDYLRLPMANLHVFEKLLEDRNFRLQIVEGNEKIEHIIARTNIQLEQYDKDVQQGLASSRAFAHYLTEQRDGPWCRDRSDLVDIYTAMKGNTEGWFNAFADLQAQGQDLNALLVRLGQMVAEMSSRAGEVSRRTWASIAPFSVPSPEVPAHASVKSPSSSMSSPRSGSRSTVRANSIYPSSTSGLQAHSQPEYFDLPKARSNIEMNSTFKQANGNHKAALPLLDTDQSRFSASPSLSDGGSETETTTGMDDGPLYILQPRTYTPQLPEPLPSPMVREEEPQPELGRQSHQSQAPAKPLKKQTSLRERVSLKTQPPDSIQIPPRRPADFQRPVHSPGNSSRGPQTPDSAYGSDDQQRPRYGTIAEMSPQSRPTVMASSPRSDHQYYRPVQASPHSPLQQRPQTAGASPRTSYSVQQPSYRPGHQRNAPSRMGGASMLSNVTTMTYDSQATETGKKLKKKRSAFGWLKKAFSLDEEERLQYEARKQQQAQNLYYQSRSPKYVDGRRVQ